MTEKPLISFDYVIKMIKENFSIDSIHRITELPMFTIEMLKKKMPMTDQEHTEKYQKETETFYSTLCFFV